MKQGISCHPDRKHAAHGLCKQCYDGQRYEANSEKYKEQNQRYRRKNIEKVRAASRDYYYTHKEKQIKRKVEYNRKRYQDNLQVRLAQVLRSRIGNAIKYGSAVRDLGCTIVEFKMYIEKQFKEGMTWDNWSLNGWHLDHILPLSSFDLTHKEEFLVAANYNNYQPLWAYDNRSKGGKHD